MISVYTRFILPIIFTFSSLSTYAAEQAEPYTGACPDWHTHGFGFWWICPLMMLFMVIFFFILSRGRRGRWGPSWWMRQRPGSRHDYEGDQESVQESAQEILDKRYARGEIDKEEYEEKKTVINSPKK